MIQIKPLASGSAGNCYYITDGSSGLLIEAGLPIKEIKRRMGYKLSDISAMLISHEHGDHSKSVIDIMNAGIDCYMTPETAKELNIKKHHRLKHLHPKEQENLGLWTVLPFDVEHDSKSPVGFYFSSKVTHEKLLYLTDSFYCKYNFMSLNYIMLEINYSVDILNDNVKNGVIPPVQKNRVIKSHMSLETAKKFLRANDLSQVKQIWLLHLSDRNSHAERFKKEIQGIAGCPVYIAGGE